ncbi:MAG: DNA-directed RNA polymerase subunit alpha [Planctomycetes bacterium]|nr:DNA-directed RNA polymerase subunit alpha [Planctomycetota bacterium]
MRIRWQGFELPNRFVRDHEVSSDTYGRFTIEPFERGFGTTIGNSLRRVLLSSLEGAAVVSIRIKGVDHEFCSIEGIVEDVTEIVLNVKSLVVSADLGSQTGTMRVKRDSAGEVRARDIEADVGIEVRNPDQLICTLTAGVTFEMEMTVCMGRGYAMAEENAAGTREVGVIPVDSIFSPVLRVRYHTEDTRVGQRTNYDRLVLEVWSRGTVAPEDAIVEASKILRKHLNPFVYYNDPGEVVAVRPVEAVVTAPPPLRAEPDAGMVELLDRHVSSLGLSARAQNCLDAVKITTVRELASKSEQELLRFRSFGKTSLNEVKQKLAELGVEVGSAAGPAAGRASSSDPADGSSGGVGGTLGDAGGSSAAPDSGPMEVFTMDDKE